MKRKRLMWTLILLPALFYLLLLVVLFLVQARMLFPVGSVGPDVPLPAGTERLSLRANSGERLAGLYIPPERRRGDRLLILTFGPNGGNASGTAAYVHAVFPQADIVTFYYRGYPPSEGSPAAAALQADAVLIYDAMRRRFGSVRTIAVGFSLGSAVAASLSAQRPLDGLILVTPFDSLGRVAGSQFSWLPVRLLFRHPMEPANDLRARPTPVAILAAGRDRLVPAARTQGLRMAAPILVFDRTFEEAGHNDISAQPGFDEAMREAMRRLRTQQRRAP